MNYNTIKIENKGKTQIIGHRGVAGLEVENTKESFIAGANRTYYGLETDIYVMKDKEFMILHDPDLKRLAGIDRQVMDYTSEEFSKINLSTSQSYSLYGNHPIFLEEYVRICLHYHKIPVIELKDGFKMEDIQRLLCKLTEWKVIDHCVIISFNFEFLKMVRACDKNIRIQVLVSKIEPEYPAILESYHMGIDTNYGALTKEQIDECHKHHVEVNAWTVDTLEVAEQLISWGIDYITTNILE